MKRWILRAAILGVVLGALGFLVAVSGVIPVKASAGHFAVTEWFLKLAKRRSLATHTLGKELSLEEPWLVLKGAGHFHGGCRPCHGAPDLRTPRLGRAMLPPIPELVPLVAERDPEELFYVVKHGVKMTGMPAWLSQTRDDEVRAVVAFLLQLPDLDAEAYRRLVHGDTPTDDPCARCHGADGLGRGSPAFPRLAGQRREYLVRALRAYADDRRQSGIMQPIAAALSVAEIDRLADHYGGLPGGGLPAVDGAAIARGRTIAEVGIPDRRVPSCNDCHGAGGKRSNDAYPRLSGQHAEYLVLQLELFKENHRGGSEYAKLMAPIAARLTAEEMRDVALYFASSPP